MPGEDGRCSVRAGGGRGHDHGAGAVLYCTVLYCTVLYRCLAKLDPRNLLIAGLKYNLIGLYGREPGYTTQVSSSDAND